MSDHTGFPKTRWSLIYRAGGGEDSSAREALADLLKHYLPALLTYLTRISGLPRSAAEDIVQGFITDKIIAAGLLRRANQTRGRFRSFLLRALQNYYISDVRKATTQKRSPVGGHVSLDALPPQSVAATRASDIFDVAWAERLIQRCITRFRTECESSGRGRQWDLFNLRILGPTLRGAAPVSYATIVDRLPFESPSAAMSALSAVKKRFAQIVRDEIAAYVRDPAELDDEIKHLFSVLSNATAR